MNNLQEYEFNTELLGESQEQGEGELMNELMGVSNEYELENFLGTVWEKARKLYNSPQGQAIKKDFIAGAKSFGKKMIPSLGKNLGGYLGGSTGSRLGGQLAGKASKWLFGESEAETTNYLRVVRKAANYLNKALAGGVSPEIGSAPSSHELVTKAINAAARPILSRSGTANRTNNTSQTQGRWIRQGNRLILQGV